MLGARICTAFLGFVVLAIAAPITALEQRIYVSANNGHDGVACETINKPCRTFAKALTRVLPGGEVIVLDSGDYDAFAITKSVSIIVAPGQYAGITAGQGEAAVTMNLGPGDFVRLKGLTLHNGGAGGNGISIVTAGYVSIEHCLIENFLGGDGINVQNGHLSLQDTTVRGSTNGVHFFAVCSICGTADAVIDHCRFENGGSGVLVNGGGHVTIRNSVATQNSDGFAAQSFGGPSSAEMSVENCAVTNNRADGIVSNGTANVRVSNSTITDNARNGLSHSGSGSLLSRQNNTIEGNGHDLEGSIGAFAGR